DYILPPLLLGGPEATIVRWLKQPGDALAAGDPLVIVVTDRAEIALPAVGGGVLDALLAVEGVTMTVGTPLAHIREARPASYEAGWMAGDQQVVAAPVTAAMAAAPSVAVEEPRRISP